MFDFHVCIREAERERFVFPAQTDRHVVVSEREREKRERERLAGRNARICWSWDFFFSSFSKAFFLHSATAHKLHGKSL